MTENEFRVRPVTRYNLTHFSSKQDENGRFSGGARSIGEFDNQQQAELVGMAMQVLTPGSTFVSILGSDARVPTMQYVLVQRGFEPATSAFYADSAEDAMRQKAALERESPVEYRIFMRLRED